MKKIILLIFVFPFSSMAFVVDNNLDGLGIEQLMAGVGQARLGSTGALSSNPALLAWLPKKQEFTSTNTVTYYKFKNEAGASLQVPLEIVPKFAATTEGFGEWGHSYGLVIDQQTVISNSSEEQTRSSYEGDFQTIKLNYAFGKKISADSSFGLGIYVGRGQETAKITAQSDEVGSSYVMSGNTKSVYWSQGLSLGYAGQKDLWAFGISGKVTTAIFGAKSNQDYVGHYQALGTTYRESTRKVERITTVPELRAGIYRPISNLKLLADLTYQPPYYDSDSDDHQKSTVMASSGLEGNLSESFKWHSGVGYHPGSNGTHSAGNFASGISRLGKHSTQYCGVNWLREFSDGSNQVYRLVFGTKFEY